MNFRTTTVDRFATFQATRHFAALDGLRAVSVVAVIWHHTSGYPEVRGYLGVDAFFAISGFLITTLLVRERARSGTISLSKFWVRRSLRILPLYYAVLALYVVLVLATESGTSEGQAFFDNLPAFATYTSNWFVSLDHSESVTFYFAWSLATEEQFYLFWAPLLAFFVVRRRTGVRPPMAAALVLIGCSIAATELADLGLLPWRIVASLSVPILLGACLALLMSERRGYEAVHLAVGGRWAAPFLAAGVVAGIAAGVPDLGMQVLLTALVVSCCLREDTALHPVLTLRVAVLLGTVSYGMYLMHMLAANVVRPVVGADFGVLVFLGATAGVTVAAYLSYRFFESPLLRVKRRYEVLPRGPLDSPGEPLDVSTVNGVPSPRERPIPGV